MLSIKKIARLFAVALRNGGREVHKWSLEFEVHVIN